MVAPGLTETDASEFIPSETKQHYSFLTALGRVGKPEDVARVIAFCASDDSNFVTGTYTPVDGGFVLVG